MKFNILIIFLLITGCAQNLGKTQKIPFNSKGFAYIYKDEDFNSKLIKYKFDNNNLEVAHNKIRQGSIIKIINPITNNYITLKNKRKLNILIFIKCL